MNGTGSGPGAAAPGPESGAPVDELKLSVRAAAVLRRAGITTVGELAARDEQSLLALTGIGPQTVRQIRDRLAERGLALGGHAALTPPAAPAQVAGVTPAAPVEGAIPPAEVQGITPPTEVKGATPPAEVKGATPPAEVGAAAPAGPAALPRRPADEEAIDLLQAARTPMLRRVMPLAGGLAALLLAAWRLRRHWRRR